MSSSVQHPNSQVSTPFIKKCPPKHSVLLNPHIFASHSQCTLQCGLRGVSAALSRIKSPVYTSAHSCTAAHCPRSLWYPSPRPSLPGHRSLINANSIVYHVQMDYSTLDLPQHCIAAGNVAGNFVTRNARFRDAVCQHFNLEWISIGGNGNCFFVSVITALKAAGTLDSSW